MAQKLIQLYNDTVGMKRQVLLDNISALEEEEDFFDYKLVRGLSTLLERACVFRARSVIDPRLARRTVFEHASRESATTTEEIERVLTESSEKLSITRKDLEVSLWADLEDELFLEEFAPASTPEDLIKRYNLSLAQTSLFKCSWMKFTASGNWKNIFRSLKWLGLMYSVEEKKSQEGSISVQTVSIDGPMSLFKMTDRYGTSLAKLLPVIAKSDSWTISAELVDRKKNRIFSFEESSEHLRGMISTFDDPSSKLQSFDSSVEEKFARRFNSLDTNWTLRREPEPLSVSDEKTGRQSVFIPDFSFEIREMKECERVDEEGTRRKEAKMTTTTRRKVYLEIVGFWTMEYMQRKLAKLSSILLAQNDKRKVDLLVAVDESLSCSGKLAQLGKLTNNSDHVILYRNGNVPLQPILSYLRSIEHEIEENQINTMSHSKIELTGDIVSIADIARAHGVSLEAAKGALNAMSFPGYLRVGECFVSESKALELRNRIEQLFLSSDSKGGMRERNEAASGVSLAEAVSLIESMQLKEVGPNQLLEALGYSILWDGLDYAKSRVVRKERADSSTTMP